MDQKGRKYLDTVQPYERIYSFSDNLAAVVKEGQYYYVDSHYREVRGPYEDALNFASGASFVKVDGLWYLMDSSGKILEDLNFEEIVFDEERQATNQSRFFAKEQGFYYLYDTAGKRLSETGFEDAKPFYTDGFAAVKTEGLWGFVGLDGTIVIEPQYEDANSFGNKVAAVSVEGKWGFINLQNRMVIEPEFEDAKCMGTNRMAPVMMDGCWRILKLTAAVSQ